MAGRCWLPPPPLLLPPLLLPPLLLPPLLLLSVPVTIVTPCGPDEYPHENLCCKLCPAGHHVSKHCSVNHGVAECAECESRTFSAHPNGETTCQSCALCREDQEVVVECSWTSEQQCRCKQGVFYCDSAHCTESCFRCSRCPEDVAVVHPCNATADTVCAQTKAEPGHSIWIYLIPALVIVIIIRVGILWYRRRNDVLPWLAKFLKKESNEPGGPSPRSSEPSERQLFRHVERGIPAPGMETTLPWQEESSAVAPEAGSSPGTSEESEESPVLHAPVVEGSPPAPEQAPPAHPPAAHRPQGWTEMSVPLSDVEQEYRQKFFLKDVSCGIINRSYYEIGRGVPESNWKMFMRFIGLEENEIEICEHENRGNVMEQHYKMLLRWREKLGKDASIFKLMAALHKMKLDMALQNVISRLVAENILCRLAENPN